MLKDDNARIPFAVLGVMMIIISTLTAAFLLHMESSGVSNAIADEREGELNDALACAGADIDNALNVACIYAEEEVGENPVINSSGDRSPDEANIMRLKSMAYRNLSRYLSANYGDGFVYGDYVVGASLDGEIVLEPLTMNMTRTVFHPALQCKDKYAAYYVASVPIKLRVTKPGSTLDHTEPYVARTLVTSRYPLLEGLTDEYEARLNGTVMFTDLTAASFAYTWARGYCQYFTGEPANIVDNGDLSLITNAASLLEQGCVYNSVDPVGLASLVKHTYDNSRPTKDVLNDNSLSYINQYNFSNTSRQSLPSDRMPGEFRFDADAIVDRGLRASIADPVSGYNVDQAYGCRMHITVKRRAVSEQYNDTGSVCKESYPLTPNENGTGPFFREVWKVWENGRTEMVTIDFVMEKCSLLNGSNDVQAPLREADFSSGSRTYTDSNLARAVDAYDRAVPVQSIIFDDISYPDGFSGRTMEVACQHNGWVENAAASGLTKLAARIKSDVAVTLRPEDYGSYDDMMDAAYCKMREQFRRNYTAYLAEPEYLDAGVFKTCGAKYAFYKRRSFLYGIDFALNASVNASEEADRRIDEQLKGYSEDLNSSTVKDGARASKDLLDNTKMFIPFGLNMTLQGLGKDDPYKWKEDVALAVDQRPNYLGVEEYTDPETGYKVRPLKVRNVCLFALPTDFVDSAEATQAVLDGIDAISGTAYRLANDTIAAETTQVTKNVSEQAKRAIKDQINDALVHDDELQGQLTRDDVESSVNKAFDSRTPEQVVGDMKNGTLQEEISKDLAQKARSSAEREIAKMADQYVDSYGDYIEGKAEEAILGAEEKALSYVVNVLKDEIKGAFEDYAAAAADKAEDAAVSSALKRIPMGLPLLPPYGWWATMNVWYVDIIGEIPYLAVYDTDNEPVPDAILGQRATVYVRRPMLDIRDGGETFGNNEPVRFHQQTCTFIIVPPGEQGIGDKLGGWEEKSPGFDEVAAP
jgi:hypothetical protein